MNKTASSIIAILGPIAFGWNAGLVVGFSFAGSPGKVILCGMFSAIALWIWKKGVSSYVG